MLRRGFFILVAFILLFPGSCVSPGVKDASSERGNKNIRIGDSMSYEDASRFFDYDSSVPFNAKERSVASGDGYVIKDIMYKAHEEDYGVTKGSSLVYLVLPVGSGKHPAVLFVHWLGQDEICAGSSK